MFYHLNPWSKKWGPLQIDGEPQLRDIEGNEIIKRVVNSAFMIVIAGSDNYRYAGQGQWYSSLRIMGPWELTETVPDGRSDAGSCRR